MQETMVNKKTHICVKFKQKGLFTEVVTDKQYVHLWKNEQLGGRPTIYWISTPAYQHNQEITAEDYEQIKEQLL